MRNAAIILALLGRYAEAIEQFEILTKLGKRQSRCPLDDFVMVTNPVRTTARGASYW
jgi:hypothetical protein